MGITMINGCEACLNTVCGIINNHVLSSQSRVVTPEKERSINTTLELFRIVGKVCFKVQ